MTLIKDDVRLYLRRTIMTGILAVTTVGIYSRGAPRARVGVRDGERLEPQGVGGRGAAGESGRWCAQGGPDVRARLPGRREGVSRR